MSKCDGEGGSAYPKSIQAGIPKLSNPAGWPVVRIGDIFKVVQRPVDLQDNTEYQLVTAKRNRGGVVPRERLTGKAILTKSQFRIAAGDFLISRRQIAHGACGIVPEVLAGAIVSNEYATLLPTDLLDPRFMRHLPELIYFQQTCFHSSIGVHVEKLVFNLEDWLRWRIPVPELEEQRRIADVLDLWDRAILFSDDLIAASSYRSNLLRSKLIEGIATPLGDLAVVSFSGVDKKINEREEAIALCNYTHIWRHKRLNSDISYDSGSADAREVERFTLKAGNFIFTKDSETAQEIAEVAYVAEDMPGVVCGYHLAMGVPKADHCGAYIAHAMRLPAVRNEFAKRANGAIRFGLTLEALQQISIPTPDNERQRQVVSLLDAADEFVARERKAMDLLRRQKRGLMQKLLTGEWQVPESIDRLMPGGDAAAALAREASAA